MPADIYDEILDGTPAPAEPAARDVYDEVLDEQEREATGALRTSIGLAVDRTPDQFAKVLAMSDRLGMPAQYLEQNLSDAERMLRLNELDPVKLGRDFPRTAAELTDADFAGVAHDDVESLTTFEKLARGVGALGDTVGVGLDRGRAIHDSGLLTFKREFADSAAFGLGRFTPEDELTLSRAERLATMSGQGDDGVLGFILANTAEVVGQMAPAVTKGAESGSKLGLGLGAIAAAAGPASPIAAPVAAMAGFGTGFATEMALDSFYVEAGHAIKEMRQLRSYDGQPLDDDAIKGAALAIGAVNAALEVTGLKIAAGVLAPALMSRLGKGELQKEILTSPTRLKALAEFGKRVAAGTSVEVVTEVIQEMVTMLGSAAAREVTQATGDGAAFPEMSWGDIVDRLGTIAVKTAAGTVLLAGAGATPQLYVEAQRATEAQNNRKLFDAIADNATNSKLRERLPARFQAAYDRIAAGTPVQEVYIKADKLVELFQADPRRPESWAPVLEALPSARSELETALASDGFLSVPVGEFAAKIAGTEAYKSLAEDVKFRPNDFTAREAKDWQANYATDFERELELAQQDAEHMALLDMPADTVQSEVVSMLRNAGVSNDVSNQYGALWRAFFATMGQRAGVAPDALLQRYAPVIMGEAQRLAQRQAVDRLDLLIDRARSGRRPDDAELFGAGLIDYLTERGGLADQGGELTARDLDKRHIGKPFAKRTVRDDGADFEAAARAAIDAGYFTEADEASAVSLESLLLEGIDRELSGQPVYSSRARNEQAIRDVEEADALAEYVRELGLDLKTATNEEIKAAIAEATQGVPREPVSTGPVLEQSGDPRWANWPADWPLTLPEDHELLIDTSTIQGREELREALLDAVLANAKPVEGRKPIAWVMGGGGGSGKGTVLKELIAAGEIPGEGAHASVVHIDPDEIKGAIPEFERIKGAGDSRAAAVTHAESSALSREALRRALDVKTDLVLDSTLGDPGKGVAQLQSLKDAGYEVRLVGVSLRTEEALARAAKRAARSGRYVPPAMLIQAHKGFSAGWPEYLKIVDKARLYDNNGAAPFVAFDTEGGELAPGAAEAYTGFGEKANEQIQDAEVRNDAAPVRPGETSSRGSSSGRRGDRGQQSQDGDAGMAGDVREAAPGRGGPRGEGQGLGELFQAARGSIQLPGDGKPGPVTINLFRSHDLTTFLHESGHFFLFVMEDLAANTDSLELRADYGAALRWLGATPGTPLTVEQHEQFARGFEAYLFEGRAPSVELEGIFARFRSWLVSVYRTIAGLNVELNDDIRGVMDRMLASEEQIEAARAELVQRPLFEDAKSMGVTVGEFERYRKNVEKARDAAQARLTARALREFRQRRTAEAEAIRAELEREVTAELDADRRYRALHFLQFGKFRGAEATVLPPLKLDRDSLVQMYGGPEILDRLPGSGASGIYRREGGVHPNLAAEMLGFESGDALVMAIVALEPRAEAIQRITDQRMRDMFGDMLRDGRIEEEALAAVHGDETLQALSAEADALNRREGRRVPPIDAVKRAAQETIARAKVARGTAAGQYTIAERRAARNAERALLKGDYAEAARQKRIQVLNHALAAESLQAREDVDAGVRYFGKFGKEATRKGVDPGYLEQIDGLLERFDFRRAVSQRQIAKRKSLLEWVEQQRAAGMEPAVDDRLIAEAMRKPYKEMTVEEFRGLVDSVKSIEHLGRLKKKLLAARDKAEFLSVVQELDRVAMQHPDRKPVALPYGAGPFQPIRDALVKFNADHIRPEFAFEYMDGRPGGPWWSRLFKPLADAEAAELTLRTEKTRELMGLLGLYSRIERATWYTDKRHFPSLGVSLNKSERLALALNWGNDINRQRILTGHGRYGWTLSGVQEVLDTLDERDWQFVQGVWNLIDSLWPAASALQFELSGVQPEKVEASPVPTRFGELPGGYYPLKYDSRLAESVQRMDEKQAVREAFGGTWARAQTRQGHLKARQENVTLPVLLDLTVMTEHIENVIHDITHRKAVLDVHRLLQDDVVESRLKEVLGVEFYRRLNPWLMEIAADRAPPAPNYANTIIRSARHGMTVVSMGWKFTTMMLQPLGYTQSVALIGERWALRGLKDFYLKPWQIPKRLEFVFERSPMMKNRMTTFDRDVREFGKALGARGMMREIEATMFAGIGFMDMAVSMPTWLGAYAKGMKDFANDEARAIAYADMAVRQAQSSGSPKDLPAVQRGTDLHKMFTMFYSYFSVLNNMLRRTKQQTRSVRDAPRAALSVLYLVVVPAVLSEIVLGRGPEDDEDWLTWAAKKSAAYPLMSTVILRDVLAPAATGYGYQMSPVADAFQFTADTLARASDGDFDEAFFKGAANALGVWFRLPTRQAWLTGDYMSDYFGGEVDDFSFYDALVTGNRDD